MYTYTTIFSRAIEPPIRISQTHGTFNEYRQTLSQSSGRHGSRLSRSIFAEQPGIPLLNYGNRKSANAPILDENWVIVIQRRRGARHLGLDKYVVDVVVSRRRSRRFPRSFAADIYRTQYELTQ